MGRLLRCLIAASAALLLVHCGQGTTPACSATDAGDPNFQCNGVAAVTLTKVQTDVFQPTCAITGCHDGVNTLAPTDYTSAAKTVANVGKDSTYANGLKVIDANKNLTNSTMWLKLLGGSPTYKSLSCVSVGPIMPQGSLNPIQQQYLDEVKGWICAGAPNN
jgi:hypothetical protein